MGYVSTFSANLSYWPGGMQAENMCGCGLLRQCDVGEFIREENT